MLDLARAQVRRGHRVLVVTADRDLVEGLPGVLPRRARQDGVEILRLPVVGGPAKQFIAEPPLDLVRAIRWADVVHHHDPRFAFETVLVAAAMLRRPVIFHTHGLFFHTARAARLKRLLMRAYYGPLLRWRTAAIVPGSLEDERLLTELAHLGSDRVTTIPTGVDLTRLALDPGQPEPGRLFMFGRLAEHKGHASVLAVLAQVSAPWRLAIAGRGPATLEADLRAQAHALGLADRIDWLGEIPDADVLGWISRARLLLFPSHYEGFGLALVEALATGAVVLASRIPAHTAILAGSDLEDRLIDFEDQVSAATRIATELALSKREIRTVRVAAIRRAGDFSIERVADGVDRLYERLIPDAPAGRGGRHPAA